MFNKLNRFFLRILPGVYMLGIWLQSSYFNPDNIGQILNNINYKIIITFGIAFELAHLIQFGILYLFLIFAFLTYGNLNKKNEYIALVVSIGYGLIDEIHQFYVPFRSFSIIDIIKDIIGVWIVWYLVNKYYYKNSRSKIGTILKRITLLSNRNKSI